MNRSSVVCSSFIQFLTFDSRDLNYNTYILVNVKGIEDEKFHFVVGIFVLIESFEEFYVCEDQTDDEQALLCLYKNFEISK